MIIDHIALGKQGDSRFGSVRPSVHLFVFAWLNRLTYNLDFWHTGRPEAGNVGQGHRSNVKNRVLTSLVVAICLALR